MTEESCELPGGGGRELAGILKIGQWIRALSLSLSLSPSPSLSLWDSLWEMSNRGLPKCSIQLTEV